MQRRTGRSVSTLGGAAPDTIIGRATADRAGARPYRRLLLLRSQHFFELLHLRSYDEPAISLIRVLREVILMIILRLVKSLERHDLGHYWIGPIFLRFSFHLFSNRFLIVILIQDN